MSQVWIAPRDRATIAAGVTGALVLVTDCCRLLRSADDWHANCAATGASVLVTDRCRRIVLTRVTSAATGAAFDSVVTR